MKANTYEYPKSSFLGMTKDTAMIMNKILSNKAVLRLLYYNTPDCLNPEKKPDLTSDQIKEMFKENQISIIPQVTVDTQKRSYLRVGFNNFTRSATNDFYRDHIVEIRIICHFDTWTLEDMDLRPYRIAGEIDSMLDGARLSGIGQLLFIDADQDVYDREFGGVTLRYLAVRGHEDDVNPLE